MSPQQDRNPLPDADRLKAELDHELGNVLNGLLGMARLVRESGLSAEQDYWLEAIEQSGRQLGRLVEAYCRHGTSREGPARIEATHFDGIELIEQVLLSHAPAARSGGNQLLLDVSTELARHWFADSRLLRQLLDNLLGNAVKFTRSGKVVLEVAAESNEGHGRDTLIIRISDSGPGVDRALGERMFEAYRQGPEPGREGLGLGLHICRNIAEAMGGRIGWSDSGLGGACFEVCLPAVVAGDPPPALPAPRLMRSLHCRLRLADPVRRSVGAILSRIGVPWSVDGAGIGSREEWLVVIEAAPDGPADPGPNIALRFAGPSRGASPARRLQAPILEATLGPLLLQMALEALSAADAGTGLSSGRYRSERPDDRD